MSPLPTTVRGLTRRLLVLDGLRWLPTGLFIPILVLLFTERGLSLTEFGIVGTIMATTTFLLELPTGGLADALGRRRVLVTACGFLLVSKAAMFTIALSDTRPSWLLITLASVTMGIYRALESGPLASWYVDAVHAIDPTADVEGGLGKQGAVTGFAIATGSLLAGGIIAWDPVAGVDPMAVVIGVSWTLVVVQIVSIALLMAEVREPLGPAVLAGSIRQVPSVMAQTVALVRTSRVLALLLVVEATWSVGMVAFENLFPVRLADVVGSTDDAAALLGPVAAVAWAASGAGAGLVVRLSRRLGPYRTGALLRLVQATFIVGMGVLAGTVGIVVAFVATYFVHGASGPIHLNLVHRQVDADHRATALSLNSMVAFAAFSASGIAIGAIADQVSVPVAMAVCATVTALGSLGYVAARRHDPTGGRGPRRVDDQDAAERVGA
ncbi:MFS transporter [Salsipaludibacter albus]|uniref:MFS transporter n=1 Tax=Salsipaludibacter albus TaxID=2849650 RepID=UPI001EE3B1CB|nr:MFS transporter [Salsipaludibacter albus]MBY5162417.1 MFS transporter [Salsipaludibacter albus]